MQSETRSRNFSDSPAAHGANAVLLSPYLEKFIFKVQNGPTAFQTVLSAISITHIDLAVTIYF